MTTKLLQAGPTVLIGLALILLAMALLAWPGNIALADDPNDDDPVNCAGTDLGIRCCKTKACENGCAQAARNPNNPDYCAALPGQDPNTWCSKMLQNCDCYCKWAGVWPFQSCACKL